MIYSFKFISDSGDVICISDGVPEAQELIGVKEHHAMELERRFDKVFRCIEIEAWGTVEGKVGRLDGI